MENSDVESDDEAVMLFTGQQGEDVSGLNELNLSELDGQIWVSINLSENAVNACERLSDIPVGKGLEKMVVEMTIRLCCDAFQYYK